MNVYRRSFVASLVLGAIAFSSPADAGESGRLVGQVHDQIGRVVVDANVLLINHTTGTIVDSTFTDDQGIYNFPPDRGTYRVRVFKSGFYTVESGAIMVWPGEYSFFDFTMNIEGFRSSCIPCTKR